MRPDAEVSVGDGVGIETSGIGEVLASAGIVFHVALSVMVGLKIP